MHSEERYDSQLRAEAEQLRVMPRSAGWNKIEQRLQRRRRTRTLRRIGGFAAAACLAGLLMMMVGFGSWLTDADNGLVQSLPGSSIQEVDFSAEGKVVQQFQPRMRSRARMTRVEEGSPDSRFEVRHVEAASAAKAEQ